MLASTKFMPMPQESGLPLRAQPVIFTTLPGSVRAFGLALQPPNE